MTCPVHGEGCFGIAEECVWIEADIARREASGECLRCGAMPGEPCCSQPLPPSGEQEQAQ